ncbi:hypothetical protein B0O99DRAFT_742005 [Bisporella sp. PMI_857]|nr:hypothetical protein B0O99DRAFT_742005 [Bisporella sp. PMI_857]
MMLLKFTTCICFVLLTTVLTSPVIPPLTTIIEKGGIEKTSLISDHGAPYCTIREDRECTAAFYARFVSSNNYETKVTVYNHNCRAIGTSSSVHTLGTLPSGENQLQSQLPRPLTYDWSRVHAGTSSGKEPWFKYVGAVQWPLRECAQYTDPATGGLVWECFFWCGKGDYNPDGRE